MVSTLVRILLIALTLIGAPATASILSATFSGTLSVAHDGIGFFGGGNLTGQAFSVTYDYDPDQAAYLPDGSNGSIPTGFSEVTMTDLLSGPAIFQVRLTVNGYTQTFQTALSFSNIARYSPVQTLTSYSAAIGLYPTPDTFIDMSVGSDGFMFGIDESFRTLVPSTVITAEGTAVGLRFTALKVNIGDPDNYGALLAETNLYADINGGTFTRTSSSTPVPEPAPIALLGFGGLLILGRWLGGKTRHPALGCRV